MRTGGESVVIFAAGGPQRERILRWSPCRTVGECDLARVVLQLCDHPLDLPQPEGAAHKNESQENESQEIGRSATIFGQASLRRRQRALGQKSAEPADNSPPSGKSG